MTHYAFTFQGETVHALASGALYWPAQKLLCVSDLHFGKAQRYAQGGASALPPYETHDTLLRLDQEISTLQPKTVICLGDSFDRVGASADMDAEACDWITRMQAGRMWVWIEGNHDPGPVGLGGTHLNEFTQGPLIFRHIAEDSLKESGEISGHFHPKVTLHIRARAITRRCFCIDSQRIIMPAFGTYTGGLSVHKEPLKSMMTEPVHCILTGEVAQPILRKKAVRGAR